MFTAEQIDLWRQLPREHQCLEFKEAKRQFDNQKLFRYCVAISNEGGGHLVLGVKDAPPREIVGTLAFPDIVGITSKIFEKVGFRVNVYEVIHPSGRVLVFQVPSRPRGTAYNFEGSYLMRSGENLVPMSEDRLREIFAEGAPHWLDEPAAQGLTGQKVTDLLDTQGFFDLLGMPYPSNREAVLYRLSEERLIVSESSGFSILRIGALLLAKRLNSFPDVERKGARVIVYEGDNKLITVRDHTAQKGIAVGFSGLVQFIMDRLPQNEVIEQALRKEVKWVPEICIRELVANALIHQDFTLSGTSVMIEIYKNRIEISNPGEPVVAPVRFIDGYQSRNEQLAAIVRRMGICEEKGSGFDKVIFNVEAYQLPAPDITVPLKRTTVTIFGPRPFTEMDRNDRVRACYQHCVLRYVMREYMTNQSLRKRFKLPEKKSASVSQIIAAALDEELIKADESVGVSRKFARYLPFWA